MNNPNKVIVLLLQCIFSGFLVASEEAKIRNHFFSPEVDTLPISDWKNPSFEDYELIQNHLKDQLIRILAAPISSRCFANERLNRELHGWITYRLGRLQLIDTKENMPTYTIDYLNNDPNQKDKCIICYAGYAKSPGALDRDYTRGIKFIKNALKTFNFDGHFIYRIGGWPNLKKDRLKYVDAPYTFKPFFFEEVRELGYKKILWLDACCIPVKNVNTLFAWMEKNGCCFFSNSTINLHDLRDRSYVARALDIPERNGACPSILTQVVGLDLSNNQVSHLLDLWIKGAERKVPFLEPSGDQLSFTLLVNHLNLARGRLPETYYMEGRPFNFTDWKNRPCIIYHQYDFLNPNAPIPPHFYS